jgi:hypothetical protein
MCIGSERENETEACTAMGAYSPLHHHLLSTLGYLIMLASPPSLTCFLDSLRAPSLTRYSKLPGRALE